MMICGGTNFRSGEYALIRHSNKMVWVFVNVTLTGIYDLYIWMINSRCILNNHECNNTYEYILSNTIRDDQGNSYSLKLTLGRLYLWLVATKPTFT
jgi:hypothetical protein